VKLNFKAPQSKLSGYISCNLRVFGDGLDDHLILAVQAASAVDALKDPQWKAGDGL
jgi:hypothetical protein